MRGIFAAVLLFGLGIAGFAVYMAQNYIKEIDKQAELARKNAPPTVELVDGFIVARQMKFGEKLALKDVRRTKWPKAAMPEGMFTNADEIFPDGDNKQRVVLRTMEKGEVLIAAKLTEPGQEAGIRSRLKEGERAFTIKVDVTSGVSGLLRPGDRVDVYWTGGVENDISRRGDFTKLIKPNVKLIAVDQSVNEEMEGGGIARTVTVAVASDQVPALNFAQSSGRLSLSLVGAGDDTVAEVIEVDQKRLLGIEDAPEPEVREVVQVEPERVCSIKTRKGGNVSTIPIPCTN
ncbi:Flp pilus assembly protein CpaB [Shimia sp. R9_1]|uniref:Flp pilus assembly protein CpaB n=1 Tax=unclassified Shimia TaxID=2630038 RepID=UPI001ADBF487|nr:MULTISPECIES: Flp pilus assembly protein CpaB [unclassified Shimia]MBO9397880.1 Flp pilus assembly protein CpaB [Shimia sp. R9_2]MBO9408930.1 Flp pilus assembly protein CpaB [Shimia sp. R9_1]